VIQGPEDLRNQELKNWRRTQAFKKLWGPLQARKGGANRLPCQVEGWAGQPHGRSLLQGPLTMEARMGRKSVVVATLLVHSVKAATRRQRMKAVAGGGTCCSGVSFSPSQSDRPDFYGKSVYETGLRGAPASAGALGGRYFCPHP
jgi:hypothetical protein